MKLYLQLNEPGSGGIKVPMADPIASSMIAIGKYIRVAYRGEFRWGFFVENIQQTPVESGDRGSQWLTANGRGPLALLDDAIIWYAQDGQATRKFENQSAAQILITLLEEAKARGCFPNLVWNFTTTEDTAHKAWADSHTLNLRVGTSMLDVVRQFAALGADFSVDVNWATNQFVLQAYRDGIGNDKHLQVVFDVGNNAKQLRQDSVGSELKNVLLVEVAGGIYTTVSDSGSISTYRRREKHFAASQAETTAQGQVLATPELALVKAPSVEIALSVVDAAQYPRAFIDYQLGDWVGIRWQEGSAPASYRIRGMQLDWEGSGYATITLELNSIRKETEIRMAQALRKIAGGSGSAPTSVPPETVSLLSAHDSNQNAHPNRIDDAEKIRGKNVSAVAPTNNQILLFDGTADEWKPANQPPHLHTESDITNLGQTVIKDGDPAGGDLAGTYPNPTVVDDSHNHTQATSHGSPDTDSAPTALHHTLGTGANQAAAGNHTHSSTRLALLTREGTLTVSAGTLRVYNKLNTTVTISQVFIAVDSAPSGAAIIVDVNKNGTTIFTNQNHRPQIAAGTNTGYTTDIDVPSWADGDYLTVDVDQVGSGTAGANLVVHIVY